MSVDFIKKVKKVIAEKSGHEVDEIDEGMFFEDDLNLGDMDLVDILTDLEEILHCDLLDEKGNLETVGDLIDLITEQVE